MFVPTKYFSAISDGVQALLSLPGRIASSDGRGGAVGGAEGHKKASASLEHGRRHYNAKRYERAEHYFRKAVRADGQYALAYYYLGLVQYKQDLADEAMASWQRATAAEPGSEAASKAERKISYLRSRMSQVIQDLQSNIGRIN